MSISLGLTPIDSARLKRIASGLAYFDEIANDPEFEPTTNQRTMKTKFYLTGGVCAASLAFCMLLNAQPSPATTASPAASSATSPAGQPSTRPLPFRGKIKAVDQSAKTFTVGPMVKGWESLPLKVTDSTKIMKGDAPGTMSDIVVNEQARGTYVQRADGTLEALTLRIGR